MRSVLVLGVCAAAGRAAAAPSPALEESRAGLAGRLDAWAGASFKEGEVKPAWFRTMRVAVDRAEDPGTLADIDGCFESLKNAPSGSVDASSCSRGLAAAAANAENASAADGDAAGRTAMVAARATAAKLLAESAAASATALVSAPPAAASPAAIVAARFPAAAPPPPVPAPTFTERSLDAISGAWQATLNAGRTAAQNVSAFLSVPTPDPLQGERQKLLSSYAGLGPLLPMSAPDQQAEYARLMGLVVGAKEDAALRGLEAPLNALKGRVLAAFRSTLDAALTSAAVNGKKFDALAVLKKTAALGRAATSSTPFQHLSMTPAGRLQAERDPSWSAAQWDRYVYWQLPLEAEIVLNTRFPVVSLDRTQGQALVFRGEDYGVDAEAKAARAEADARAVAAAKAAGAVNAARAAATVAENDLAAAQTARTEREAQAAAAADAATQAGGQADQAAADAAAAERDAQAAAEEARAKKAVSAEEISRALMKSAAGIDLEILFSLGSAKLSPQALPQLEELGKALAGDELSGRDILINGHTDARGGAAYNLDLSQRRAESVKSYLIAHAGLSSAKLTAQGYGFSRLKLPAEPYSEKNRRVQIAVKGADVAATRSDLEAQAAQTQADLESRAAEKAQTAAAKAQAAAAAAALKLGAAETAARSRQDAADAAAALAAARTRRDAAAAAVPAAEAADVAARTAAAQAAPAVDAAEEKAQGAVFVRDFRANHYSWFGAPDELAERLTQTLTDGFRGYGADGAVANRLFESADPATGRTLAQDLARDMADREAQKSNFQVFREKVGDMFNLLQGRWVDVIGHVGGGGQFVVSDLVPDSAEKQSKPVPVEIVTSAEFAKLSARTSESTAPDTATVPVAADPALARPEPDGASADAAAALQDRRNAESAAETARVQAAAAQSRAAAAADARRLADQAASAAEAAARARRDAQAAADDARVKQASAAQIRAALTKNATSASIDLEIYFAYGSAQISDAAIPQLIELGRALTGDEFNGSSFFIYGHTDARGGAAYNQDLSRRRAEAVRDYLASRFGLAPERLVARGFGFSRLKVPADPLSEKNRRVQVGILRP